MSVDSTRAQDAAPDAVPGKLPSELPKTIPPPFRVAEEIDRSTLLTAVELKCAEAYRVTQLAPETLIVKYEPARMYLTMTPAQWTALRAFGFEAGRSVPQVLFRLIMDRMCVPLREFYELVIKAFDCGLLQAEGHAGPAPMKAATWRWHVDGRWMRGVAALVVIGALVALIARPMKLPQDAWDLGLGWMLVCVALSAGYFVGACVTRRAGAEVYQPGLRWKTLWPHFHADLRDAIMAGTQTVVDASLMRMAPMFFVLAAAAFWESGVALVLFGAVMVLLSPFWWSPGLVTIHARYGAPRQDATRDFQFEPNQAHWYALKTRWRNTSVRFLAIHAMYAVAWLGIVLLMGSLLLRANAEELWRSYVAAHGLHFTALALLTMFSAVVAGTLGMLALVGGELALEAWRDWRRHRYVPRRVTATPEAVQAAIAQSELFRHLPAEDHAAIAAAAQLEEFPAHALVVRENDPGDTLYVVFSGRVEVLRELNSGRQDPVAELRPGDLFGEIPILESRPRTRSVRTIEKSVLLSLTREAFQRLVLSKISRQRVEDTVQKIGFLHRIPLARNWSPHAMAAFARRATFQTFGQEEFIIREGEDNQFFYVLYEGELSVRRLRQELAVLRIGDFFGEISLLQNSVAKATIQARVAGKCLVMSKREFLQFLATDFVVGLQFESISSKRLGQPIFPLKGKSFDVLRG